MNHYHGYAEDFIDLVEAFPASEAELRAFLLGGFGVHLSAMPYPGAIWMQLSDAKGEDRAADILAELVVTKAGDRVRELVVTHANEGDLYIRANDPELVHVLFQHEDLYDQLGDFVADYWLRSRGPNAGPGPVSPEKTEDRPPPEPPGSEDEDEPEQDALEMLRDLRRKVSNQFTGSVDRYRPSAALNTGFGFERVTVTQRDFLTADPTWLEAELEDYLWENWERIDFGLSSPLVLFDRQARINPDRLDRVDLLAKNEREEWFAIELKIVPARTRDLTQLLSYMSDLAQPVCRLTR